MASLEDVIVRKAVVNKQVSPLQTDGLYVFRIRLARIRVSLGLVMRDSLASTVVEAEETGSLGTEVAMLNRHGTMANSGLEAPLVVRLGTNLASQETDRVSVTGRVSSRAVDIIVTSHRCSSRLAVASLQTAALLRRDSH